MGAVAQQLRKEAAIDIRLVSSPRRYVGGSTVDFTRLLVAFGIFATVALRTWDVVVYGAQYLMVLAVVLHLAKRRFAFRAGAYAAFYGFFTIWCALSALWARDADRTLSAVPGLLHFTILGTVIAAYVIAESSPEFLMNCLAWSVLGLVVVLVILTPPDVWRETMEPMANASSDANRLGYTVRYHPNALGRVLAIGALLWIFKLREVRNYRLLKLLVVIALVTVLLLTKSRLSIALLSALVLLFLLFTSRDFSKFMMRATIGIAGACLTVWAFLTVQVLYDAVGFRFAAMWGAGGTTDASTATRAEMIRIAFDLFGRNPIGGVGFENFAYFYYYDYSGWAETYSHSNYFELLAGVGAVGLLSYYAIPIWVTGKLASQRRSDGHHDRAAATLLLLLAISQLVADTASISYTNDFVQLVTVLLFSWVVVNESRSPTRGHAIRTSLSRPASPSRLMP